MILSKTQHPTYCQASGLQRAISGISRRYVVQTSCFLQKYSGGGDIDASTYMQTQEEEVIKHAQMSLRRWYSV